MDISVTGKHVIGLIHVLNKFQTSCLSYGVLPGGIIFQHPPVGM